MSPTAINTYFSCPRKFYFRYVRKLPTRPSIYLIRGQIIHNTLRRFHEARPQSNSPDPLSATKSALFGVFSKEWQNHEKALQSLDLPAERLDFFRHESEQMLKNFAEWFCREGMRRPAFSELKIFSNPLRLMGIIDAVMTQNDRIVLVDYKTSSSRNISEDILRQAALYALLYQDKYGQVPEAVWIHFIKDPANPEVIEIDEELLVYGKIVLESVRSKTVSSDEKDYPCTCGGFCERDFTGA
jgi:CRISPR/Cas system-associated exonuclease Cas4 (RecB family)